MNGQLNSYGERPRTLEANGKKFIGERPLTLEANGQKFIGERPLTLEANGQKFIGERPLTLEANGHELWRRTATLIKLIVLSYDKVIKILA